MGPRKRAAASRSTEEDGEAGGGSKAAKKSTSRKKAAAATDGDENKGTSSRTSQAQSSKKATADKKVPASKALEKTKEPSNTKNQSGGFSEVYQFKITLKDTKPPIWRRIQVPEDDTFKSLHEAIQDAMGWRNCHLHQFKIGGTKIGPSLEHLEMDDEQDEDLIFDHEAIISDYFYEEKTVAMYTYDFGNSWEHRVLFEKAVEADPEQEYPKCLAGKRACPPEDVGGTDGHADLVEAIKAPPESRDAEMKELVKWVEDSQPGYDPEFFDAKQVSFRESRTGGL